MDFDDFCLMCPINSEPSEKKGGRRRDEQQLMERGCYRSTVTEGFSGLSDSFICILFKISVNYQEGKTVD